MPIIKSAKKRVKVAAKASARNVKTKRAMREAIKAYQWAVAGGKPAEITKAQAAAFSAIDKAAKKAVIHKNKAARKKARLSAEAKATGVKAPKAVAKEAAPAKPKTTVKKTRKPAAKKKSS